MDSSANSQTRASLCQGWQTGARFPPSLFENDLPSFPPSPSWPLTWTTSNIYLYFNFPGLREFTNASAVAVLAVVSCVRCLQPNAQMCEGSAIVERRRTLRSNLADQTKSNLKVEQRLEQKHTMDVGQRSTSAHARMAVARSSQCPPVRMRNDLFFGHYAAFVYRELT